MGLKMEKFDILGVHWKILFFFFFVGGDLPLEDNFDQFYLLAQTIWHWNQLTTMNLNKDLNSEQKEYYDQHKRAEEFT